MIHLARPANNVSLWLGVVLTACLGFGSVAYGQDSTCDPTKASCVPATGISGISGSSCTPVQQALGQCTSATGGSSGGTGDGGSVGAAPMCTAAPGGNPSCGGGPATTASTGPSGGAGNPINLLNGNKYQEETDLAALPGVLGLELRRYYNSQGNHPGLVGANWRMSYESVLYDFGGEIQILQADGRRLMFQRGVGAHAALCSSPQPLDGQVRIESAADGRGRPTYHWRWADGRTLSFSGGSGGGHPLQAITAATGERITLSYSPSGELTSIRDPQGRKLVFIYASSAEVTAQKRTRALKAIDTPLGRITYRQDALGRLTEVAQATDAVSAPYVTRLYHYEDRYSAGHPLALTGISVRGVDPQSHQPVEQRLSTYAYNAAGQAILSTKGRPREMKDGKPVADTGIEQVEVQYLARALPYDSKVDRKTGEANPTQLGRATLTNSLGQQTQVTSAVIGGHFRLIEMRGAGCVTCGPAGMRYAYDKAGLLIRSTRIDREGQPVRSEVTELDKFGRTARVGLQAYANKQPQSVRWMERYEYADITYPDGSIAVAPRPSLVARPSVIPGKEHTVAMSYNAYGQVTKVTESGFSPVDAKARASPDGTLISRTTTHTYQVINGRSVIQRIDGSLASGDATRFDWDAAGNFITAVTLPGDLITREQQDPVSGRPTLRTDAVGVSTRFEYAQATTDRPSLVERAGQSTSYRFDILGRVVRVDQQTTAERASPNGGSGARSAKSMQLQYDLGDHLIAVTDAQGYKAKTTLDSEGQALVAGLYEPEQALPLRATYRWYDERRRLAKQLRADGRIDIWTYDQTGELADHTDGDDVLHLTRTNRSGLQSLVEMTPDGFARLSMSSGVVNRYRSIGTPQVKRDDFGRAVIEWRPEQGLALRTYDAGDHLVREDRIGRDGKAAGHFEQTVDAAGRSIRHLTFDSRARLTQTIERVYAGALLKEQRDDAQVTTYEHDAMGRVVATRITLKNERGQQAFVTTLRTRYDSRSEVESQTLADGRVMWVHREATGMPSRITLQSNFWSNVRERLDHWLSPASAHLLQGWLPDAPIVRDITFHPYNGVTGYTQGNGVITRKRFDLAGRLSMLQTGDRTSRFDYGIGPRIQRVEDEVPGKVALKASYEYDGFGMLKTEPLPRLVTSALNTEVGAATSPIRDSRGRTLEDAVHTYLYTESGQIDTVLNGGKPIAKYRYNGDGQRVSKTLLGTASQTTYYLWSQGKLVAEIKGQGEHRGDIAAQYLYLSVEGKTAPIAKLENAWADGNETRASRSLFIHNDQRGAPVSMTDLTKHVVWEARSDAWGFIDVQDLNGQEAQMNIRLPGQYFDAETGLHDNWHRSYDPRPGSASHGRYLTPDPAGYPDGLDSYAYVEGDPVNKIDPLGLYEVDIHYYMTYFLATVLGMNQANASTLALATQFVDDNNYTTPISASLTTQADRLRRYHFVLWTADGGYSTSTNLYNSLAQSQQLRNLKSYATPEMLDGACPVPNSQSVQFMGEFLHAFEDSFGHRDQNNVPIAIKGGLGHAFYGSNPDYTYNHTNVTYDPEGIEIKDVWNQNESRTLGMEYSTYQQIQTYINAENFYASGSADKSKAIRLPELETVLISFNKRAENNDNTSDFTTTSEKINTLNEFLVAHGFSKMPSYNVNQACRNRQNNFGGLRASDYPAAIIKTGTGFMGGVYGGTSC